MLLVNIPFIISWFMMYRATSTMEVFIAYAILGFGVGLTEGFESLLKLLIHNKRQ